MEDGGPWAWRDWNWTEEGNIRRLVGDRSRPSGSANDFHKETSLLLDILLVLLVRLLVPL